MIPFLFLYCKVNYYYFGTLGNLYEIQHLSFEDIVGWKGGN